MTEELRLWSIGESGDVEPLKPLQQMPTELELARAAPRPVGCREAYMENRSASGEVGS